MLKDFKHQYIFKEDTEESKNAQFQTCFEEGKEAAYASIGTDIINNKYRPSPIDEPDVQMSYCDTDNRDYLKNINIMWANTIGIIITDVTLYTDTGEIVEGEVEDGRETITGKWLKFTGTINKTPTRIPSVKLPEDIICLKELTTKLNISSKGCIVEDIDTSHVINMDYCFNNFNLKGTINLDFSSCKTAKYCFSGIFKGYSPTINVFNFNTDVIGTGMYANNIGLIPEFIWRSNYNAVSLFENTKLDGKLVDLYPEYSPKLYSRSFNIRNDSNIDYTDFVFSSTDDILNDCIVLPHDNYPTINFTQNTTTCEHIFIAHRGLTDFLLEITDTNVKFGQKGFIYIDNIEALEYEIIINFNELFHDCIIDINPNNKDFKIHTNLNRCKCNIFYYNNVISDNGAIVTGNVHIISEYPLPFKYYDKFNYINISTSTGNVNNKGIDIIDSDNNIIQSLFDEKKINLDDCYLIQQPYNIIIDKTNAAYNKLFFINVGTDETNSDYFKFAQTYKIINPGDGNIAIRDTLLSNDEWNYNDSGKIEIEINDNRTNPSKIIFTPFDTVEHGIYSILAPFSILGGENLDNTSINNLHIIEAYSVFCSTKSIEKNGVIFIDKLNKESDNITFDCSFNIYTITGDNIKPYFNSFTDSVLIAFFNILNWINEKNNVLFNINTYTHYNDLENNTINNILAIGLDVNNLNNESYMFINKPMETISNAIEVNDFSFYDENILNIREPFTIYIENDFIEFNYSKFIDSLYSGNSVYFGVNHNIINIQNNKPIHFYLPNITLESNIHSMHFYDDIKDEYVNITNKNNYVVNKLVIEGSNSIKRINGVSFKSCYIDNNNGLDNTFETLSLNDINDDVYLKFSPNLTDPCINRLVNIDPNIPAGKTMTLHTTVFQKLTEEQKLAISSKMTLIEYIP